MAKKTYRKVTCKKRGCNARFLNRYGRKYCSRHRK